MHESRVADDISPIFSVFVHNYTGSLSLISVEGRTRRELVSLSDRSCTLGWCKDNMSGVEDVKEHEHVDGDVQEDSEKSMHSSQQEEEVVKKKYGGIMPKKPPLISKDHERAYFDSADWALGKQGVEKPKGPLEALRPKLQPTQQQTRYRKSPYAPSDGEDGGNTTSEEATPNE
uniref:cAMP-regulated phosphoprotein 19-related protein n=2 Tax=Davidia involucrata TaxID=16924 RepID=A0A5B6Z6D7_DAVIN